MYITSLIYKKVYICVAKLVTWLQSFLSQSYQGFARNYKSYSLVTKMVTNHKEVILLKIDMLEVKKDRLKEVNKQLNKAYRSKYAIDIKDLYDEKKKLLGEIKDIESKRGVINE